MTSSLRAPNPRRSYSVAADWLELLALVRNSGVATDTDLTSPYDLLEDRALGAENELGVEDDPDVVNEQLEKALDAVAEEIGHRERSLAILYPFEVEFDERRFRIKEATTPEGAYHVGQTIYIACLLISCIRSRLFAPGRDGVKSDAHIGRLFQIAATLAAAGYVSGDAYWFGAPRPDETPLIDALGRLATNVGVGEPRKERPEGETRYAQDAGIDVVAWRDHCDRLPAKLILYGQCASGMNWEGKPVTSKVNRLMNYFSEEVSYYWIPALFTPFPLYMEKEQAHQLWTIGAQKGFYRALEREMGIIIDRLRVVDWAVKCINTPGPGVQHALEEMASLEEWTKGIIGVLREAQE